MEIKCDFCGKKFEYTEGMAHYKRSENHYCSRSCQAKANNLRQGNKLHGMARGRSSSEYPKRYKIWCNARKRARKKGKKFSLEPEDIPEIPEKCPILGIPIEESNEPGPTDNSPSLDRINPEEGYTPENVRIISNRANRLRQDATVKELELILEDMKDNASEGEK